MALVETYMENYMALVDVLCHWLYVMEMYVGYYCLTICGWEEEKIFFEEQQFMYVHNVYLEYNASLTSCVCFLKWDEG